MAVNRICEKCSELNKTCKGMAAFYSGCIYFKKEEDLKNDR
jgi:hypothetical protein